MDWFKPISRHIIHPLYIRREGRNPYRILRELDRSQFFSPDQIASIQLERLRTIVRHAYDHTEYYRKVMDQYGLSPDSLTSLDQIRKFPILTKDDIRNNPDSLISNLHAKERMIHKRTGGSTSVPLKLWVDQMAYTFKEAATMRHNSWAGYHQGDKMAALWGNTDKPRSFREKLFGLLLSRVVFLDTLKMDAPYMRAFIQQVRDFRPTVLMGHAHSIYYFARFVEEEGAKNLGFTGIISTAEILYDYEREKIEHVFGNILFDRYGCEELSIIASECEAHDGLHVCAEGLYVEVLDADDQYPGKLVITDLWNHGMPFIRYEIGDMATIKTDACSCGRGLPRLGRVLGRTADVLYTPEGKAISGISILDTFTIHVPGFKQVQVIQDLIDHLTFNVVRDDATFTDESESIFGQSVAKFFGSRMRYNIRYLDKIPQTERGKYRFSICNIPQPKG